MVDRSGRLRILGVAVLALLVMGGVVASALVARAKGQGEEGSPDSKEVARARDALRSFGRTEPDRAAPMPSGCEPDPKSPAGIRFDLPDDVLQLGSLRQGVQVECEVTLRNVGSGPL